VFKGSWCCEEIVLGVSPVTLVQPDSTDNERRNRTVLVMSENSLYSPAYWSDHWRWRLTFLTGQFLVMPTDG